jgi:hypothetical protein
MGNYQYIPRNAVAFVNWLIKLLAYVGKNYARWGIATLSEGFEERAEELRKLTDKCLDKDHSPVDTLRRNEARKTIERDVRSLLKGFVLYNPNVTEEDRRIMGLPVRDSVRTPVGDPEGQVTAKIKFPNERTLELHIEHVGDVPTDKRANYGVKIAYDVFPMDAPAPENASALHRAEFTRRKKKLFTFDEGESRKIAWFRLRYENRKGKAGQWGPMISAVIP